MRGLILRVFIIVAVFVLTTCELDDVENIRAQMQTTYTVTFNGNNGSGTAPAAMTASSDSTITLPGAGSLTRSGHTFGGWNTNAAGTGTNYNAGSSYTVTDNVTLFARWNPLSTFTVIFNANGATSGTAPAAQTVNSGSSITLPGAGNLTRTGHNFGGWNTNAAGTGTNYAAGSAYIVTGTITLFARWNVSGPVNVPGANLTAKLSWLETNAASGNEYIIEVTANESIAPHVLSYSGRNNINITLRGAGTTRIVNLSVNGSLFTVGLGVTLFLENITLQGHSTNNASLVMLNRGSLVMNTGSIVTGNTQTFGSGGGVYIQDGGILTMTGGTISDNTASDGGGVYIVYNGTFIMDNGAIIGNTANGVGGGGVFVGSNGIFTINGGNISDNFAYNGGGVFARSDATFTMNNGIISNNISGNNGGGVSVYESVTFTMADGTISGNSASGSGGGVYIINTGTFNKTSGTIHGYSAGDNDSNVVKDAGSGAIINDHGHAVYVNDNIRRENTAGPGVNLYYNGNTNPPTYSGGWESVLTNTNDIGPYLAAQAGGTSTDNPVHLPLGLQLTETNWQNTLAAIDTAGKFVALDLTACTRSSSNTSGGLRSDGTFDPGSYYDNTFSNNRIVSITLPDAATSIAAWTDDDWIFMPPFSRFGALRKIEGKNIITIGDNAFGGTYYLTSVSFPQATSIGSLVFNNCHYLESISFHATATVSIDSFYACSSLSSFTLTGTGPLSTIENGRALVRNHTELVAYPSASGNIILDNITTISPYAFFNTRNLTSVSFPQVTSIGEYAFAVSLNLTSVYFPQVISISEYAFYNCHGLTSVEFPQVTSIGVRALHYTINLTSVVIPRILELKDNVFLRSNNLPLVITMGSVAPRVGINMISTESGSKSVTMRVPAGATGYGSIPATYTTDTTTNNWANAFRGKGWDGTNYLDGTVNSNITLNIVYQ